MKEIWKDIKGYEGLYQISNLGRVKSIKYKNKIRILKNNIGTYGYYNRTLSKNGKTTTFFLHRLVAKNFIENPNNLPCVNHKDGNKLNNRADNLEWCTYSENLIHAYKNKLKSNNFKGKFGKDNLHSKEIYQIDKNTKKIISKFYGAAEAKRKTNINANSIIMCCRKQRKTAGGFEWSYVKDYNKNYNKFLGEEE